MLGIRVSHRFAGAHMRSRVPARAANAANITFHLLRSNSTLVNATLKNDISSEGALAPGRKQVTVDRELPDVMKQRRNVKWSFVGFSLLMAATFTAIIKYEEVNAPVVSSTLYTLRRSRIAREQLGENIVFSAFIPWIYGKVQAGRGIVDFSYYAKGDKGEALVHFDAKRSRELNRFVVLDWSFTKDGKVYSLLEEDFHPLVPGGKEEPTMRRNLRQESQGITNSDN